MIPVEPFVAPTVGTREFNAVKKAVAVKPRVESVDVGFSHGKFNVDGRYDVWLEMDADGQIFGECKCRAGTPPVDAPSPGTGEETEVPKWEPVPCYHLAAVLLYVADKEIQFER